MYNVSQAFRDNVVSGNQLVVVKASVILGGSVLGDLDILSGVVTLDSRRDGALRSLSLTVSPDESVWPWLTTFGAEIQVWRGLTLSGVDELVPLGVFVIDADLTQTDDGPIQIEAADRSQRISRNGWDSAYVVAAGTDVGTAVSDILTNRWPSCPVGFSALGLTTSAQVVFTTGSSSNPWKDAKSLMESVGYDLYFDGLGVAQCRPTPNPLTAPVSATYYGGELDIKLSETKKAALSQTYNKVVYSGEGTGVETPVQGIAQDDDPTSPTYVLGPMGTVTLFPSSPLMTTQDMVDQAAATRFSKVRGRVEQISWSLLCNPAHEPGDVVQFVESGVTSRHILDQLAIPLTADPMTAIARETYRSA